MQRAGLELMGVMAMYQEGAYERLCRYILSASSFQNITLLVGSNLVSIWTLNNIVWWSLPDSSRWVQAECRKLGDTDNPEVGDLLRTAVRCLKEKPALFKYCAEEVSLSTLLNSSLCL